MAPPYDPAAALARLDRLRQGRLSRHEHRCTLCARWFWCAESVPPERCRRRAMSRIYADCLDQVDTQLEGENP